jgi:photosystem II stability/assembly factor-like uncharacterized protein
LLDLPELDDARLAAMLDLAKERSKALGQRRRLRRRFTGLAALVLVIGTAGAVAFHPRNGAGTDHQASNSGSHSSVARAPSWKLVGDVSQPSWQEQPSLTGPGRAYGLVCPTAMACYMQESDQPASGPVLTSVEVTQDGGSTWQQSLLPAGDSTSTRLACVDADTCMAGGSDSAGNAVFLTTDDGGQSWTVLPGPSQLASSFVFLDVSCTGGQSCVAIGQLAAGDNGAEQGYDVLLTTDAGQTWSASPLPSDLVPEQAQCLGGADCVITGWDAPSGDAAPSQGAAIYSTDSGATWAAATVPDGFGPVTAVSCADQNDCIAVTPEAASPGTSWVLATTDGGQTWTLAAGAGLPAGFLQGLACATSSLCWAAAIQLAADPGTVGTPITLSSVQGVLAVTNDGGQTWQTAQLPADLSDHSVVTAVACPTATTCFATVWLPNASPQGQYVLLSYDSSGN